MSRPGRYGDLEAIAEVARSGRDLVSLWREVTPLLADAIPHFQTPCFFTVDPSSLLTTSHFQEGFGEIPAEWLAREFEAPDFNSMTEVLRSRSGVGTLHDATEGQPERATKYHEEMQPFGCEQELAFSLRSARGESWGAVSLYREQGRPLFTEHEKALAAAAGRVLADGVRFALLLGKGTEPDLPDPPGVLVLDQTCAYRPRPRRPGSGYQLSAGRSTSCLRSFWPLPALPWREKARRSPERVPIRARGRSCTALGSPRQGRSPWCSTPPTQGISRHSSCAPMG
jgi:hypothetical protein